MSPVWRHGTVVPVEFTYEPVPWLSSKVRKVLPVVPSRLNATYRKLVERVDSSEVQAACTFDFAGVTPPAWPWKAQNSGASSLVPPMKVSSTAFGSTIV